MRTSLKEEYGLAILGPMPRKQDRKRVPRRLVAVGVLVLLAGTIAAGAQLWYQTTDFFCLYHGGRSLLLGRDPYNEVWWGSVTGGLHPDPRGGLSQSSCPGRFGYPLWTAVALLPFGLLPLESAASLWEAVSIGATLAGTWAAWRAARGPRRLAPLFAVLVLTSQPFWLLIVSGQMTGVMLGLAGGLALLVARKRDWGAGVALAALAVKPQIVVLTLPVFAFRALMGRRRRLISAVLATGGAMLLVPMLFVFSWPVEWLGEITGRRLRVVALLPTA